MQHEQIQAPRVTSGWLGAGVKSIGFSAWDGNRLVATSKRRCRENDGGDANERRGLVECVFLPKEGERDGDDDYDEEGYLIIREDGLNTRQEEDEGELGENEVELVEGEGENDSDESAGENSSGHVVLSSVDLFDDRDAALFTDEEPSYDSWRARNKKKSLTTFRNYDSVELGADELNDKLQPDYLERHRYVLKPDEAFGAIFTWESVLSNARELELAAWSAVAAENDLVPPDLDDIQRAELMNAELAIQRVFFWASSDWAEVKRLLFRKLEVYNEMFESFEFQLRVGAKAWLESLSEYNTPMCICASVPRVRMEAVLEKLGIRKHFQFVVCAEEEFESVEQMLLLAAIKLERAPQKCAVFTDTLRTVIGAHEVSAKSIGLLGVHRAYEMKIADACVRDFEELVVYNVRRLFSQTGREHMDPVTELEKSSGGNDRTTTQIADR